MCFNTLEISNYMKQFSKIFSIITLIAITTIAIGVTSCNNQNNSAEKSASNASQSPGAIAYVNIDTLQEYYTYFQDKKAELEAHRESMSKELKRAQQRFQNDYLSTQRKVQAGTLTQAEYESSAKRLQKMQQSLESRDAALAERLLKEQNDFNKDLKQRLNDYLAKYNERKNYDYILSYSEALSIILLAKPVNDITQDIINGLNEEYKTEQPVEDSAEKEDK